MKMINNEICGLVEWMPRNNSLKPEDSFCKLKELKKGYINMVCDFYEQKIKIKRS